LRRKLVFLQTLENEFKGRASELQRMENDLQSKMQRLQRDGSTMKASDRSKLEKDVMAQRQTSPRKRRLSSRIVSVVLTKNAASW
jgi:Skp family chaperone for outer membrane proteins